MKKISTSPLSLSISIGNLPPSTPSTPTPTNREILPAKIRRTSKKPFLEHYYESRVTTHDKPPTSIANFSIHEIPVPYTSSFLFICYFALSLNHRADFPSPNDQRPRSMFDPRDNTPSVFNLVVDRDLRKQPSVSVLVCRYTQ